MKSIWIEVANGQELRCDSLCKGFQWIMQKSFQADVYMLPLGSYDLILGKDDIKWNFANLTMSFTL